MNDNENKTNAPIKLPDLLPERRPHRMFCSCCGEVIRVIFHVPDEIWAMSVHISQINNLICLRCFTRMADERGVEWGKDITFQPVSQLSAALNEADALRSEVERLKDSEAYLTWKLQQVLPLFEEARDALPAITVTVMKMRGISPSLADRMDTAGTAKYADYAAIKPNAAAGEEGTDGNER